MRNLRSYACFVLRCVATSRNSRRVERALDVATKESTRFFVALLEIDAYLF